MASETVEMLAEIHGTSVEELVGQLTEHTPEEVQEARREHFKKLGSPIDPDKSVYERADASDINNGTYKQRDRTVRQFADWYSENEKQYINTATIREFFRYLVSEGYAASTLETRYWQLTKFLTDEFNKTTENQIRDYDRQPVLDDARQTGEGAGADPITEEEKDKMKEETDSKRLKLAMEILWQSGLRVSELANLRSEQIDLDKKKIRDVETAKRSGHTRPPLSFNLRLKNELRKWEQTYRYEYKKGESSPYLLPTHKSEKCYPRNLTKAIKDIAKRAEVQGEGIEHKDGSTRSTITGHSFRKGFAIQRLREGASVRKVQLLLGHSDISTTQDYLPLDDDDLDYTPR